MSSSNFSLRFLLRSLPASSSIERWVSAEGLGSDADSMLLRLCVRRHLLARLDKGAILTLASVTVADLTPAMKPSEEVPESDLACRERDCSATWSKSSKHHRSLRDVTRGTVCCLFRRRRVLIQRWKGFWGSSSPVASPPSKFACSSLLWMTLRNEAALLGLGEDIGDMLPTTPRWCTSMSRNQMLVDRANHCVY